MTLKLSSIFILCLGLGCKSSSLAPKATRTMLMAASSTPVSPFSELRVPAGFHKVSLQWHSPPGWETNGISFNVREVPDNDNRRPLTSCHVLTNVQSLHVEFYAHPGMWRGVTSTNYFTGEESGVGIAPVEQVVFEEAAR